MRLPGQTVYTREVVERLSDAAGRLGAEAGVFVKVDTGLRRVGVWHEEAADLNTEGSTKEPLSSSASIKGTWR